MMNPQFMPPGQNNNGQNNTQGFLPPQDLNGHQNQTLFSQMPPNGPAQLITSSDQPDVTHKMQNLGLNGPQGFNIPSGQMPPMKPPEMQHNKQFMPPSQTPPSMSSNQLNMARPPGSEDASTPSHPQQNSYMPGLPHMPPPLAQTRPPVSQAAMPGPAASGFQGPPMSIQSSLTNPFPPTSQSSAPMPGAGQQPFPNQSQPAKFSGSNQQHFHGPGQPNIVSGQPPYLGPGQSAFPNSERGLPPNSAPNQPPFSGPIQAPISRPNQQSTPVGIPPIFGEQPPTSGVKPEVGPPNQPLNQGPGFPPNSIPGPMSFSGTMQPPMSRPSQVHGQSNPNQPQVQPPIPSPSQPPAPNQPSMLGQPSLASQPHTLGQNSPAQPPLPNHPSMLGQPSQASQLTGQSRIPQHPIPGPGPHSIPGQAPLPSLGQPSTSGPGQQFSGQPQLGGPALAPGQQFRGQSGQPPLPGQQFPGQSGHLPLPGQQYLGQPPLPGQQFPGQPGQQFAGQQPLPGQQPLSSGHLPGQPLLPGHPPMSGPGQPSLPGQQPQFNQPPQHNRPPMMHQPGQPIPGPQMPAQFPGHQQLQGQHQMPGHVPAPGHPPAPGVTPGSQQMGSGYPPQYPQAPFPGQQPSYPAHPQYAGYQQPQQQVKKLDPDQMPSPIKVMIEDQRNRGGIFVTNDRGLVPPLVTTDFVVDDKGNSSPRYIRSSMYSVPVTADLLKQTSLPLCLVISPMAELEGSEQEPPLLDFAALTNSPGMGPVRCSRCKAYMCPNMKFIDAGRHFKCAFCKATTEVPMEYTQYINSMQQYGRTPSELALGTYEIVATKEYCRNNAMPNIPAIVFVIDVSYNAVKSGLVQTVCDNIQRIVDALPKDAEGNTYTRLGFITYSSTVHFYNIKGTRGQPQMLSVGDVSDMFVPLLDGFLLTASDSGDLLPALLRLIPTTFADNKETEIILLPAVQAGLEALKAADTAGQLLVFHSSLPTYPAPGKLTNREERKLLGTDKEKQVLGPVNTTYNEVGQSCSSAGVCVDLFVANNAYVDLATIGQLARLTGGQVHKYTYFQADVDGERLVQDARRCVSRPVAHDAVLRVRTSTGVRATDFYGHLFMSNTTDVELAAIDSDKAIGVEIKHDDKLTSEEAVYIQTALLYTHRCGQRRLRILNLALSVAAQLADVYRSCDLDTLVNFLTKQAVWYLRETAPRAVSEALTARCAKALAAYRRHCATPSSAGQLVLPESCKLLPLYTSCMLRGDALGGGPDLAVDDRWLAMAHALAADVPASVAVTYPRLLALHVLPEPPLLLRASADKMDDGGVYLLENGVHMLVWVGAQTPAAFTRQVFGADSPQHVDTRVAELPALPNALSQAVRDVVSDARARRRRYMRLTLMRQHDKLEAVLRHFLVEDRGLDGHQSYVDYLCHIHKEIRNML